jgi:hypothetical protein
MGYTHGMSIGPEDPYISGISEGPSAADYEFRFSIPRRFAKELKTNSSRLSLRFGTEDPDEVARMVNKLELVGVEVNQSYTTAGNSLGSGLAIFVGEIVNGAAIAAFFTALASAFKAYTNRRSTRKVVIYDEEDHKPVLEVNGNFTTEEIEALLRARLLPRLQTEDKVTNELPDQAS